MDELPKDKIRSGKSYYLKLILTLIPFILIILIISFALWQLGVYKTSGRACCISTTGWAKLNVVISDLYPAYYSKNQSFTVDFNNYNGVDIRLMNASVMEKFSGVKCTNIKVNGSDISGYMVSPTGGFRIDAQCLGADLNENDNYEILVDVEYDTILGKTLTTHQESSSIRGYVE